MLITIYVKKGRKGRKTKKIVQITQKIYIKFDKAIFEKNVNFLVKYTCIMI